MTRFRKECIYFLLKMTDKQVNCYNGRQGHEKYTIIKNAFTDEKSSQEVWI